jgi:hypothetical protein
VGDGLRSSSTAKKSDGTVPKKTKGFLARIKELFKK